MPADQVDTRQGNRTDRIRSAVRLALNRLSAEERDFIERFFYMGQSAEEISIATGRRLHLVRAAHYRAFKKLRRHLAGFVRREFGVEVDIDFDCPICNSEQRKEIDRLLLSRDHTRTWKHFMNLLREDFNISITSPQILISHEKYH